MINLTLLEKRRDRLSLTYKELAKRAGMSPRNLRRIVNSIGAAAQQPNRETLAGLEDALCLQPGKLTAAEAHVLVHSDPHYPCVYDILDEIYDPKLSNDYFQISDGKDFFNFIWNKIGTRRGDYNLWHEACLHLADRGELMYIEGLGFRISGASLDEQILMLLNRLQEEKRFLRIAYQYPYQGRRWQRTRDLVRKRLDFAAEIKEGRPMDYPELGDFEVHAAYAADCVHLQNQFRFAHRISQHSYARAGWLADREGPACVEEAGNCPPKFRTLIDAMHFELEEMFENYNERDRYESRDPEFGGFARHRRLLNQHVRKSIRQAVRNDKQLKRKQLAPPVSTRGGELEPPSRPAWKAANI